MFAKVNWDIVIRLCQRMIIEIAMCYYDGVPVERHMEIAIIVTKKAGWI